VRTPLDPPTETAGEAETAAHQAAVIAGEIARLEDFKAGHLAELEEIDAEAEALGRETVPDATIRLIRRYEAAAIRELERARAELDRLQGEPLGVERREMLALMSTLTLPPEEPGEVPATAPAAAADPDRATPGPKPEPAPVKAVPAGAPDCDDPSEEALRGGFSSPIVATAPAPVLIVPRPRRRRDARSKGRPARAAQKGFPR